jgi:hypothetical protein
MRELYRTGSRSIGETILKASVDLDSQDIEKAKEVYEHFLSSCTSKFYSDLAKRQLGNCHRLLHEMVRFGLAAADGRP